MGKIKVLIADDHPTLRIGIRHILEQSADITVVAEAANGQEAIQLVDQYAPDVLLLDLQMPVMDGFDVLDALYPKKNGLKTLILSANNDRHLISETLAKGAWAYYLKEEAPAKIVEAVLQAFRGKGKGQRPDEPR